MEEFEPGTHLILAVLGVLIFELNKAAASTNSVNIASCNKQLSVARDYVKSKEDFRTSLEAFPTKFIEEEQGKVQKIASEKEKSAADYDVIEASIKAVDDFEKLLAVIVNLVTMAKQEGDKTSTASALYWSAIVELNWAKLKTGKIMYNCFCLNRFIRKCHLLAGASPPSGRIASKREQEYSEPPSSGMAMWVIA